MRLPRLLDGPVRGLSALEAASTRLNEGRSSSWSMRALQERALTKLLAESEMDHVFTTTQAACEKASSTFLIATWWSLDVVAYLDSRRPAARTCPSLVRQELDEKGWEPWCNPITVKEAWKSNAGMMLEVASIQRTSMIARVVTSGHIDNVVSCDVRSMCH